MKHFIKISVLLIILSFLLNSCGNSNYKYSQLYENLEKTADDNLIITNKIMYDVPIVNNIIGERSKNNPDWFWNNIPIPQDEIFIKSLFEDIQNGNLKIYYYDNFGSYDSFDIVPENKIKDFIANAMSYKFDILDTTVNPTEIITQEIKLDYSDIKMLRFLEEWYIDDGTFCKNIIAIAPFFTINAPYLDEPLNKAYFWVLLNSEKYTE